MGTSFSFTLVRCVLTYNTQFIVACKFLGLASNLRVFPSNEIAKGALTMKLKHLKQVQESIEWPQAIEKLPVVTWESCELTVKARCTSKCLVQSRKNRKRVP
jgi:hypothetical protein